ncbi:hypothetical protein WMF04_38160 [Sorangium sp. So ce260]|uniref:hypothetical protein n=1 Tax=Sorangium sp. So ce260 TaxID=3133291 RepID=UPI003F600789
MGGRQRRRGLALMAVAAAAHLGCVLLGALHVDLQRVGRLGWGVAYHGALSGAEEGHPAARAPGRPAGEGRRAVSGPSGVPGGAGPSGAAGSWAPERAAAPVR